MHWLAHFFGTDNLSGAYYGFWSGVGSDITEFALFGALVAHYRRMTCHVDSPRFCWRPGTHPVPDTPYRVCKKHHPDVPEDVTPDHVMNALEAADQSGRGVV